MIAFGPVTRYRLFAVGTLLAAATLSSAKAAEPLLVALIDFPPGLALCLKEQLASSGPAVRLVSWPDDPGASDPFGSEPPFLVLAATCLETGECMTQLREYPGRRFWASVLPPEDPADGEPAGSDTVSDRKELESYLGTLFRPIGHALTRGPETRQCQELAALAGPEIRAASGRLAAE
jgi:hypothetical protein